MLLASEYADAGKVARSATASAARCHSSSPGGADIKAVVGFHAGLSTNRPDDAGNIKGSVLVCIGTEDPLVPPAQRQAFEEEMRGGVDWRMNLYGGAVHSFTNPAADGSNPAIKYEANADARSWRAMLDLFDEKFR